MRLFGDSRRIHLLIGVTTPILLLTTTATALLGVGSPATTQAYWAPSRCQQPKITYNGVSATPTAPALGSSVQFHTTMTASCATTALIDFEVYNSSGARAWAGWMDNQQLTSKQQTFSKTWTIPTNLPTGAYTLKMGVFSPHWGTLYNWNNAALPFKVQGATTPSPTSTPASAPQTSGNFTLLPVGAQLPSDAQCAALVKRSSWEPRPDNATANNRNFYAEGVRAQWNGKDPAQSMMNRATGNFTGTTDEIIQWAACKWGFDVDTVRAQAVQESDWHQSTLGDCRYTTQPETHGCASVGILQVKGANIPATQPGTWPYAYESTAWNLDYALSVRRACFEGKISWLGNGYHAGDEWGCIGYWFSGHWYDSGAQTYINSVKAHMANKDWLKY